MSFFDKLIPGPKDDIIEFLCEPKFYNIIPKPFSSKKLMPTWYKRLPQKIVPEGKEGPGGLKSSTIKRCPPFLDAMSVGWILPLCADVQITTNEDASYIEWNTEFDYPVVENHIASQIKGHPKDNLPPIKFLNYWAIRVSKGWSVLFVPPLNRPNQHFECLSGIVDCDGYFEYVNFPSFFNTPNWHGVLPAGTPLVQVIPIKRDNFNIKAIDRPMTNKDLNDMDKTRAHVRVHESHYRNNVWEKK